MSGALCAVGNGDRVSCESSAAQRAGDQRLGRVGIHRRTVSLGHLPALYQHVAIAGVAKELGWKGPLPSAEQLDACPEHSPGSIRPYSPEQLAQRFYGDARFPDPGLEPVAFMSACHRWDNDRLKEHESKVRAWERLGVFKWAVRKRLGELAEAEEVTPLGIRLLTANEREIADVAEETAREYARWARKPWEELSVKQRKLMCPRHQKTVIRGQIATARQFFAAAFGTVGGRTGTHYVDAFALDNWRERQARAAEFGKRRAARGVVTGTTIPMWMLMEQSRQAAVSRLYTMCLAVDALAQRDGLAAVFITLTLPPEWHPNPTKGKRSWTTQCGPKAARNELMHLWSGFRARLAKKRVRMWGCRVIEPHKDGCPHLHALLYVRPEQIAAVRMVLADADLFAGGKRQTDCEEIDRQRSRPTTYLMKYLAKSVNADADHLADGLGVDADDEWDQGDHLAHHAEVRAWAADRRIRRFAFLGAHGVQRIWQRIFTWAEPPSDATEAMRVAWQCMRDKDWGNALAALMGLALAYETKENAYGETIKVPVAIIDEATGTTVPLKAEDWEIIPTDDADGLTDVVTVADSYPSGGADAPPDHSYPDGFLEVLGW